jgi:hypothetical protein
MGFCVDVKFFSAIEKQQGDSAECRLGEVVLANTLYLIPTCTLPVADPAFGSSAGE